MSNSERIIYVFVSLFFLSGGGIVVAFKSGFYQTMAIHGCALFPLFLLVVPACMVIVAVYLASLAPHHGIRWPAKMLAVLPLLLVLLAVGYLAHGIASSYL